MTMMSRTENIISASWDSVNVHKHQWCFMVWYIKNAIIKLFADHIGSFSDHFVWSSPPTATIKLGRSYKPHLVWKTNTSNS